jgi:protein-S-isoprenylcysteine O-methyltransferase Ste14
MIKLVAFAVLSACLASISWGSLRVPRSHGFYRFFAWELIAALFLLNVDGWFRDPLSWHQLASWLLLTASLIPLVLGIRSLRGQGRPMRRRQGEPQLLAFEKTAALVDTGIYHYVRHPLYGSLLFLTWPGVLLALAATLFLLATAVADEAECVRFFGPAYESYMKRTKRFVPFLF